ncbi:MAG: DUF1013 domain-containing protein [Albidovulum sp.]|nr:DUF1013 domain-containing protein [Albidovulum sp.]
MGKPIMAKATAVWLVDNTTLTFDQIAHFCGLHLLEVQGIADGEVAVGIRGFDPVANNQLEASELDIGQADPEYRLKLKPNPNAERPKGKRGPRYTPLSKRQDRPAAISWLVKYHPELSTTQITKLIGTTKPTIDAIRNRTHWNISSIQPTDPVALGLCKQIDLDEAVRTAAERKAKERDSKDSDSGKSLMGTKESLKPETDTKLPSNLSGLETFTLTSLEKKEPSSE